tara:strand:- start:289 stop:546 length:258 start_codon:yes stop_codon:yes gene_type:complete
MESKWITIADKLINTENLNSCEVWKSPSDIWYLILEFGDKYQKQIKITKGEDAAYDILKTLKVYLNSFTIARPLQIEESELAHND